MTTIHTHDEHRSTLSGHKATRQADGWHVTYLPGRILSNSQAMSAIVLAELSAAGPIPSGYKRFVRVRLAELGLTEAELPQPLPGYPVDEGDDWGGGPR